MTFRITSPVTARGGEADRDIVIISNGVVCLVFCTIAQAFPASLVSWIWDTVPKDGLAHDERSCPDAAGGGVHLARLPIIV